MAKKSTVHKIRKMEFKKIMIVLLAIFWIFVLFANDVTNFQRTDRLREAQVREELIDESKPEETESVRDAWDVFDDESSVSSARESQTDSSPAVKAATEVKAEKEHGFSIVVFMAWLMVIVLSVMAVAFVDGSAEEDFLALAVVLGLPTIFLTPFPMPIDEATHFFRCYMMSRGHILQVTNKAGLVGDYVPAGLAAILRHPENQLTLRTLTEHIDYWTVSVNGLWIRSMRTATRRIICLSAISRQRSVWSFHVCCICLSLLRSTWADLRIFFLISVLPMLPTRRLRAIEMCFLSSVLQAAPFILREASRQIRCSSAARCSMSQ